MIGRVKKKLKIPVLVNGDIVDFESFEQAIEVSKADGVLIARGALGKPWIFKEIKIIGAPSTNSKELRKIILEHAKLHFAQYGELITLRKHLVNYVKGMKGAKKIREKLVRVETMQDLKNTLKLLK